MEFIVKKVKNLKYGSEENSVIELDVLFEGMDEYMPFAANPKDPVEHGRDIFKRAKGGEWGDISPYSGPSKEQIEEERVRFNRDVFLRDIDAFVTNPLRWAELTDDQKGEVSQYRKDLLDITEQDGFPMNVVWPVKPEFM